MKHILLIGLLILSSTIFGQELRKKYIGTYEGVIPGYKLDIGGDVVDVKSTRIVINLEEKIITQEIGNTGKTGTWKVTHEGKTYFIITVMLEGQAVEERMVIYRKGHKMTREGIYPQPAAELTKIEAPSKATQRRGVKYRK